MQTNGTTNELVSMGEARRNLIPRKNGKEISPATAWRWVNTGINGVRLEVIYVGNTPYTSAEMVAEFFQRVTAARISKRESLEVPVSDQGLSAAGLL